MISLSKLQNKNGVNVNVKPGTNVNVNVDKTIQAEESVKYPPEIPTMDELKELANENEVLKLLIDILQSNPLVINKYIIADDVTLMKFIKLLTDADDVQLDIEDIGEGCCTAKTYRKIHSIYVIKDNETKNLKYDYPRVMKELSDLHISTKFAW